ncbi:Secondary metabolism regulator LAE1 [Colletotrichum sp. SAR 10_86]|nr:Secondary metabolism regulator LAE1 [Colletotrichum sp. SAR 10_65]KAI8236326.1 Secondary metabolism regulator LAE1 [Colletotrichum sp. SAR 10_86]
MANILLPTTSKNKIDWLGLAPPNDSSSNVKRVLDIGTGTGIWAMDFGEDHPDAEVLGIDLSMPTPDFNLKPGGYFELQELEVYPRSDDNSLQPECALSRCMSHVHKAFEVFGRSFQEIPQLLAIMKEVGFVDVELRLFKWPSNSWPKHPKFKELGFWNNENINNGFEAITMAPFTRALGWTREEVHEFLPSVRRDLNDKSIHAYWPVYVVYGRKPVEK